MLVFLYSFELFDDFSISVLYSLLSFGTENGVEGMKRTPRIIIAKLGKFVEKRATILSRSPDFPERISRGMIWHTAFIIFRENESTDDDGRSFTGEVNEQSAVSASRGRTINLLISLAKLKINRRPLHTFRNNFSTHVRSFRERIPFGKFYRRIK